MIRSMMISLVVLGALATTQVRIWSWQNCLGDDGGGGGRLL
jgi:hypothetical protein